MEPSDLGERLLHQNVHKNITRFATAGFLSRLCFHWLDPLLSTGRKKVLEQGDLPHLAPEDEAKETYNRFMRGWNKQQKIAPTSPSIFRTLASCHWKDVLVTGLYALIKCVTLSIGPLVLNAFVRFAKGEVLFKHEGYALVAALFLAKTVESASQRQWYFGARRMGMHVRSALIGAIYQKELKLSNSGRRSHAAGEVVNYMAVDAYRVGEFPYSLHMIWTTPLQIIIALAILFFCVGWASLAGVSVIVMTMFLNGPVVKMQQKVQRELLLAQDERLRATSESLRNMKILKLQAWEDKFIARINQLRLSEEESLRGVQCRKTMNSIFFWVSPILVTTTTLVACYFLGIPLTASNVFTALATLRIIQEPIRSVPDVASAYVNVNVSLARISRFLCEDELDPETINRMDDDEYSIRIEKGSFDWDSGVPGSPTLRNINLMVKHGSKVAICGEVGSGKTTLLQAILGEVPKLDGKVSISGAVAYVAQAAWIQSGSIRDNILLGLPMHKERYLKALKSCALDKDLDNLPSGDRTEIGERGLNVSGGQKQRIQLARAVYQDADVYLLDDPFSAVDAQTGSILLKNCILGALRKKTIILVTHQVDFLPSFDTILLMQNGKICETGNFDELLADSNTFKELVTAHKEVMGIQNENSLGNKMLDRRLSSKTSRKADEFVDDAMTANQLTKQEEIERGDTGARAYWHYLSQANGFFYGSAMLIAYLIFTGGQLTSNWWMASEVGNPNITPGQLIGVYAAIGLGTVPFVTLRSFFSLVMGIRASRSFFSSLMVSLFQAPMTFFDSTPTGRIMSRLAVDLSILDVDLPFSFQIAMSSTLNAYSSIGMTAAVTWQVLVVVFPVVIVTRSLQSYYLSSARELMRIQGTTRSPLANHFQETIAGVGTIRAYGREELFMEKMLELVDENSGPAFYSYAANEWLIQRLETLWSTIVCCSALVVVLLPAGQIDPGFVGLAITYGLSLNTSQVVSVQNQCTLANLIISVERIKQYMHLPSEEPAVKDTIKPPPYWPNRGRVELQGLQIRYSPEAPLVLRGVTCTFEGGQKVGIVGRTGSGKTTLISALFRLVEPAGGKIIIDGVDITKMRLKTLRSRLSIIPQEPTLFSGTVRFNVDPLEQHSDVKIWEVLGKCQLGDSIRDKPGQLDSLVGDDGENWSAGQRQLFCLARVLLKKSMILVLDEATASIDNTTDAILQKLLREEFSECTVITVAHRIPTVIDSDMVLGLADGEMTEFDAPENLLHTKTSLFSKLVTEYWSSSHVAK